MKQEAVLLVMDLFIDRKLTKKTLASFLNVLIKLMPRPNNMPKSQYLLFKYLEALAPPLINCVEHFYCNGCLFPKVEPDKECTVCKSKDFKKFYELPIGDEIRYLFEKRNLADVLDQRVSGNIEENSISDVCDGTEYKTLSTKE